MQHHEQAGDRTVLITSASRYIASPLLAELGMMDLLCTELEVDSSGRFTGHLAGKMCFGAQKVVVAQDYCRRWGTTLEDAHFYSDSITDRPLLTAVGHPVAVNPDPRLRRVARSRGWKIERWG